MAQGATHRPSAAEQLGQSIAGIAERAGPAILGLGRGWGRGSGVVVDRGRVLTSAHHLRGDAVTFVRDGESVQGRVLATDHDRDLALVEADTGGVEPVAWDGPGSAPTIGTPVIALANPGGRGLRATLGFVSAAPRTFRGRRGRRVEGAIEHTAPLPRGSSGGPLVDLDGRLLAINTLRLEGGLILAVSAGPGTRERLESLARGEARQRPRLGIAVAPPRVARRLRAAVGLPERDGVLVRAVEDGSPAEAAGIRRGDLVVRAGDLDATGVDALYAALDAAERELDLTVVRGTEELELTVPLAGRETAEA